MQSELEAAGVKFIDWPSKSPDLHPIESIQKHHKALLEDLRFSVNSAARQVKDHAIDEMRRLWQRDAGFSKVIEELGSIAEYMRVAKLCRDNNGGNKFNA